MGFAYQRWYCDIRGLRDAQDNKVPITIALIGALLRECTLQ
jgi:hypothetical protein